ncbi:hypothetical protein SAMN02927924_01690 [Sphingobium faniae]|nr:hypothetical protein SAMN02927924_01690 [Sphingobium faniae]
MFAKQRLYLTADRSALVAEGNAAAAFLYAAPGDEIPESAARRFGLVDGELSGDMAPANTLVQAILRAAAMGVIGPIEIAGLTFTNEFRLFAKGDIDDEQLLAMVTAPQLVVEALQFVDDEAKDWGPIPGLADFIPKLALIVATARSIGADMPRLGDELSDELSLAVNAAALAADAANASPPPPGETDRSGDDGEKEDWKAGDMLAPDPAPDSAAPAAPATPAPAQETASEKSGDAPQENKEKAPAEDKEQKRGHDKGRSAKGAAKD